MKLASCLVASAVLLLAFTVRAEEDAKKAQEKLKGSWEITSMTIEGNENGEAKGDTLTVDGDKWTVKTKNNEMEGTLKLGTDNKLSTIDMSITKGDESGKTALGIYELKDGTLKFCLRMPGETERPKEFKSEAGSKCMVIEMKKK